MSLQTDAQRDVTRIALDGIKDAGSALAGSGAIREHGIIQRPTEDMDLFTTNPDLAAFDRAVDRVALDVREAGYVVEVERRTSGFARLNVRTSQGQYLDVDAIRGAGLFTDEELNAAAAERDAGFEVEMFATQLDAVRRITHRDVAPYGVSPEDLDAVKERSIEWAAQLRGQPAQAQREGVNTSRTTRLASFPTAATDATRPPATEPDGERRARQGPEARGHGYGSGAGGHSR